VEDCGAEGDLNCGDLVQEVSEEKNVSKWPRECSSDVLVKDTTALALVQKKKKKKKKNQKKNKKKKKNKI
jgi:hypothetical protein